MKQFYGQHKASLTQYLLPVLDDQSFLSRNLLFQRLVVFLGLHVWALVFYSYGEIFAHLYSLNIGGFPESEVAHGD